MLPPATNHCSYKQDGRSCQNSYRNQNGAVLLAVVLVLLIAVSGALLASLNAKKNGAAGLAANAKVLGVAKQALVGYAVSLPEALSDPLQMPGLMPCPDINGDGVADSPCGNNERTVLGRLPWKTLGVKPLRDNSGECLWYVVSGRFKQSVDTWPSSDSHGMLHLVNDSSKTVIGSNGIDKALAIIITPGRIVQGQERDIIESDRTECGSVKKNDAVNRAKNYLDRYLTVNNSRGLDTAAAVGEAGDLSIPTTGDSVFITVNQSAVDGSDVFNDQLSWVDAGDYRFVFKRMNRWVARRVQQCLEAYGDSHVSLSNIYPWAAKLNSGGPVEYADDDGHRFGRIPSTLATSAAGNTAMQNAWPVDPLDGGSICFTWSWWDEWKDQVFYAVNKNSAPTVTAGGVLEHDGSEAEFVVIVAGRTQVGQSRATVNQRGDIQNYLENDNVPAAGIGAIPGGNEEFSKSAADSNDIVCSNLGCG